MYAICAFGRGYVVVGDFDQVDNTNWLRPRHAATVRRWGTSTGLGELANGPLSSTVLDPIPFGVEIPLGSVHGMWRVKEDKWEKVLKKMSADRVLDVLP